MQQHDYALDIAINSILENEGKTFNYSVDLGCVPSDTYVFTTQTYKPIVKIKNGEELINAKVMRTFSRDYSGNLILVKPRFLESVLFTPEHPVLIAEKKDRKRPFRIVGFKPAFQIIYSRNYTKSDYVVVPKFKIEREIFLEFPQIHSNNHVKLESQFLDIDWAALIGWYIAEGYTGQYATNFALGEEPHYAQEISEIAKRKGLRVDVNKDHNGIRVRIFSKSLAQFLEQQCGKGAHQKHLPNNFIVWKKENIASLINAYVKGDGCKAGYKAKNRNRIGIVSVSKLLIRQLQLALLKLDIVSSYYSSFSSKNRMIENRHLPPVKSYHLEWSRNKSGNYSDEEFYYFKVSKKEMMPFSGQVHNLHTSDNIFQVPFVVHNCGEGSLGYILKSFTSWLVGVDINANFLNVAYESSCYGELVLSDIFSYEVPIEADSIFMFEVVEHFDKEIGLKLLEEILALSPSKFIMVSSPSKFSDSWHHKSLWTSEDFFNLGFHDIYVTLANDPRWGEMLVAVRRRVNG